jgi:peptidoglycan hydrolase-like protein with peptidoglycan-binding domain
MDYQRANNIAPINGRVGPLTRAALNGLTASVVSPVATEVFAASYIFTRDLSYGSVGADVRQLQTILRELGYFKYPSITGRFVTVTRQAVMDYQRANNIAPINGRVGPLTRASLNK